LVKGTLKTKKIIKGSEFRLQIPCHDMKYLVMSIACDIIQISIDLVKNYCLTPIIPRSYILWFSLPPYSDFSFKIVCLNQHASSN